MNVDLISSIIERTLKEPNWDKLTLTGREYAKGQSKAFVSLIPCIGGAAAEELQQYYDYKDDEFFRKFVRFLMELKDTTLEERHRFVEEIQQIAESRCQGTGTCHQVGYMYQSLVNLVTSTLSLDEASPDSGESL